MLRVIGITYSWTARAASCLRDPPQAEDTQDANTAGDPIPPLLSQARKRKCTPLLPKSVQRQGKKKKGTRKVNLCNMMHTREPKEENKGKQANQPSLLSTTTTASKHHPRTHPTYTLDIPKSEHKHDPNNAPSHLVTPIRCPKKTLCCVHMYP